MSQRPPIALLALDAAAVAVGLGLLFAFEQTGAAVALVWIALGVYILIRGADMMVRGAARLATLLGVSPFLVGLTVVAFGTSAPELAASVGATLKGEGPIAIGNVLGSNIANLCLILPLTGLVRTIVVRPEVLRFDLPLMIVVSILASIPILDGFVFRDETGAVSPGVISQLEGAVLVAGLGVYVWFSARTGRVTAEDIEAEVELELGAPVDRPVGTARSVFAHLLLTLVGLGGLILGAELLVDGGKSMASAVGMSSAVIGLTVVAIGTSIPELAFSVRAAQRGQSELALANVLGSNAFNLLSVLGIAAIVDPIVVPEEAAQRDVWVMLAISTLVWPIVLVRRKLGRPEGLTLLAIYAVYLAFVVWPATAG